MTSSLSPQDAQHLTRALDLAAAAVGLTSPNPTVGCVLTRPDGSPIGEGAHLYDLRDHAEIAALKDAASHHHDTQAATAFVTLEPCSHHGRTPPCADALIASGIARCVIATADPNPLVAGQGILRLRDAGIDVLLLDPSHPLALRARRLNDAFALSIQHHRPFVTLKAALSVDGMLAPPPSTRTSTSPHWLTGPAARADVQLLRHSNDAILTGIGTVLADNPTLTDRSGLPRRRPLLRIVLDTHLRIPLTSTLVTSANPDGIQDLLLLTSATAAPDREAALTSLGIEVHRLPAPPPPPAPQPTYNEQRTTYNVQRPPNTLNLHAALSHLAARNLTSLLLEAGSALNGAFLRANLVDRAVLYFAERELGPDAIPFAAGYPSPYLLQQRLTSLTRTTFPSTLPGATQSSEDIRITGYLHGPWTWSPSSPANSLTR